MLLGYVSDQSYAALADVAVEFHRDGRRWLTHSGPSGAVELDLPPGAYEVCLAKAGFGSKRTTVSVGSEPVHFRLLSDSPLGYAWPKWCRCGDRVEFRVHAVEPFAAALWRYGQRRERIRQLGWFDNHGPRANRQRLPDAWFVETGVDWDNGFGLHRQFATAPQRSGLYYFRIDTESGREFSFPLVVAPRTPSAPIAVLASTNTWNAYNPFGGRSNYIMAAAMLPQPIVEAKVDLPRYRLADYGEWKSGRDFAPLSFDRPEPYNHIPSAAEADASIPGRQACHLAAAEWRLLAWLERLGFKYDLFSDYQLHDGTLPLDEYKVLVLNTHPEYWSAAMYRRVKDWVTRRGGRLAYLGGNGINCCVEFDATGTTMTCRNHWPDHCESRFHAQVESEAALLGVVYTDAGAMTAAPYEVVDSRHWVFRGTGLRRGDVFGCRTLHERCPGGASGHETDKMSRHSPAATRLLARGLNPDEGGAHMTLWQSPSGGAVFSAGSIIFPAALLCDDSVSRITANVIRRFVDDV